MEFSCHPLGVDINRGMVDALLAKLRRLYDQEHAPDSSAGCKDCGLLGRMVDAVR
jgi:hypothetical protein